MRRWSEFEKNEAVVRQGRVLAAWVARSDDGYTADLSQALHLDPDIADVPHVSWVLDISRGEERWLTELGDCYDPVVPVERFAEEVLPWALETLEAHGTFDLHVAPTKDVDLAEDEWGAFVRLPPFRQDGELLEEWEATTAAGDVARLWEQSGRSPFIEGPERPRAWLMHVRDWDGWTLWQGAVDDQGGHIPRERFYDVVLPAAVQRLALADRQRDLWRSGDDGLGRD